MNITGIKNKDESSKVKAFINIEINDVQLKGFKIYENEDKELKLMLPSAIKHDKNGEVMKNAEGNIINFHPIIINPDLSNRSDLFKELEKKVIEAYNEPKEAGKEKEISKAVSMPEFEKGELKSNNVFSISKDKQKNPDYQFKATSSLCVGAFRINQVNLIYNTIKNDYNVIFPQYQTTNKETKEVTNMSFVVPKDKATFAKMKNEVVDTYNTKMKEYKEIQKKQNLENTQKQAQQQGTVQNVQTTQSQGLTQ